MSDSDLTAYARGLMELGDFILRHEELFRAKPSSYAAQQNKPGEIDVPDELNINVQCSDAEELAVKLRMLGAGEKYSDVSEYFSSTGVRKNFGPHQIDVYATSSKVCTPKRRETRSVPKVQLTDEARAQIDAIRAAHTAMETTEVATEWECPPSLLSPKQEASS